jgi:hypothetical protein
VKTKPLDITLEPVDNDRLANLCGPLDENLRQIETAFDVNIARRGEHCRLSGDPARTRLAAQALEHFYEAAKQPLSIDDIQLGLVELRNRSQAQQPAPALLTKKSDLHGRTPNQVQYLRQIQEHDITFGIGPAGTGKTYLAVASAVDAFERDQVQRIVLTRPAVVPLALPLSCARLPGMNRSGSVVGLALLVAAQAACGVPTVPAGGPAEVKLVARSGGHAAFAHWYESPWRVHVCPAAQRVPHAPQFIAFERSASQPLAALRSQSAKPAAHALTQRPPTHAADDMPLATQALPQLPQCRGSVASTTSQPLRTSPSQLAVPLLHTSSQARLSLQVRYGLMT